MIATSDRPTPELAKTPAAKVLLHFVARNGCCDSLCDLLQDNLKGLAESSLQLSSATAMRAREDDSMRATGDGQTLPVAFDASLELIGAHSWDEPKLAEELKASIDMDRLAQLIHADLSSATVGENKVFIDSAPTPIRFQYCMRRRADHTDSQYFDYYEREHSKFGFGSHGIEGYVQFHIDQTASAKLANALGFGVSQTTSVSELHIADMETFFTGMAKGNEGGDFSEDEDRFVDRRRSVMWVSDEYARA